jgi:ankyrin repeat protein
MTVKGIPSRLCHLPLSCLVAVSLIAPVWIIPAFSGEIHDAAMQGDLETVKGLLKDNPNLVSGIDGIGDTPLHVAALYGNKDIAEWLLAQGADVNAKNNAGDRPLHDAAVNGQKDGAALLLANKAEINARNNKGQTPLYRAASIGRKDVVELLLACKADVNAKDKDGNTPLHEAAAGGHQGVVGLLLAAKADVNARNNYGKTPLNLAMINFRTDVYKFLRRHGGKRVDHDMN